MTSEHSSHPRSGRAGVQHDPARLDVARLAEAGASLAGQWPVAELPRLASSLVQPIDSKSPPVRWRATGERARLAGAGECPALRLEADADVTLECQRCLEPLTEHLHVDRKFFYVEGEDTAAALDLESEDDVAALQRSIDLRQLVEDELLLALPLIPRHPVCPGVEGSAVVDAGSADPFGSAVAMPAADHPFAQLATLKRRAKAN